MNRVIAEGHQSVELEVGRGVDHPTHHLPLGFGIGVRADLGVDDGKAFVLDAAAERGHLSHVIHDVSRVGAVTGARPKTRPSKSSKIACTASGATNAAWRSR